MVTRIRQTLREHVDQHRQSWAVLHFDDTRLDIITDVIELNVDVLGTTLAQSRRTIRVGDQFNAKNELARTTHCQSSQTAP